MFYHGCNDMVVDIKFAMSRGVDNEQTEYYRNGTTDTWMVQKMSIDQRRIKKTMLGKYEKIGKWLNESLMISFKEV